ncbi:MAG TPA: acyl-CoA dehydrogenase family protein [Thermomicrobiales bacterium]|nr:acyl-CoA dehydrogenase family protein [Thermomicrobiales bacterium]
MSSKPTHDELRRWVREVCERFPGEYWREKDKAGEYPTEFVDEMIASGYLSALIPEEYGGFGLGVSEAAVIVEEINRSGGAAGPCHGQMYMSSLLRHASEEQKRRYLPKIASGELRLQTFGVTEPNSGTDTTRLQTTAVRDGDYYIINGQKIFISRVNNSDLMLLLARTTPLDQVERRTHGLSLFLIEQDSLDPEAFEVQPIDMMINNDTNQLFFDNLEVPASCLIGEEGMGFRYLLDGLNTERILIAAECVGDGRWFVEQATEYAKTRVVFQRPIGQNQGIQFPLARAYANVEAAALMVERAATLFDAGEPCGPEANMAKLLAADASWEAANVALQTFGGYGFAKEYDVERKFRETRLYQVAPISTNLILSYIAEHVLGLPRSF